MSDPLIDALAGWEDRNGTMAAILPDEWTTLMVSVKDACITQSPRQLRAEIDRLRAALTTLIDECAGTSADPDVVEKCAEALK